MYEQLRLFPDCPWLYSAATVLNGRLSTPKQPPPPLPPVFSERAERSEFGARFVALLFTGYLRHHPLWGGGTFRGFAMTVKPLRTTITLKRWRAGQAECAFISDNTTAKALRSLFLRSNGGDIDWKPDNYA